MVHKFAKRWDKMIETSDMLVYGKPDAKDVLIAEKWSGGWAIDRAVDVTPRNFKGEWKFMNRILYTNVGSKADARKEIQNLIKEKR